MASTVPRSIIAPSILAANFSCLGDDVSKALAGGADWLHCDVMDGHFVPNISFGVPVVAALRASHKAAFLDVHLMVSHPEEWVDAFAEAGANTFAFHIEATSDPAALISRIVSRGMLPGIALKPATPVEAVFPFVDRLSHVLVMTVEPGFGGQSFMEAMMPKVSTLRARFPGLNIQVDGGLGPSTVERAASAGANVIVAGTSVFRSKDIAAAIADLRGPVDTALASRLPAGGYSEA